MCSQPLLPSLPDFSPPATILTDSLMFSFNLSIDNGNNFAYLYLSKILTALSLSLALFPSPIPPPSSTTDQRQLPRRRHHSPPLCRPPCWPPALPATTAASNHVFPPSSQAAPTICWICRHPHLHPAHPCSRLLSSHQAEFQLLPLHHSSLRLASSRSCFVSKFFLDQHVIVKSIRFSCWARRVIPTSPSVRNVLPLSLGFFSGYAVYGCV